LRAENPLNQELKKGKNLLLIKKILLKYILLKWLVDKCLYIGSQSKSFFDYYGVAEERLLFTPYAVNNDYFRKVWIANRGRLAQIREELNLPPDKKIILFSGKYIPKKRPLDLLKAYAGLDQDKYFLLMVGEGALRQVMEEFIRERQIQNVRLTGFINQSEISSYYAIADIFVMCSGMGETWGLSVNEAMNFAKPVIVSDTCGCSTDLVRHGVNGFVFEEGNSDQLQHYLQKVLEDDAFRDEAGKKSMEIIDNFSIGHIVQNIRQAT
jgi:glycosyltransferase involved in cell wall biosynthesis